MAYLEKKAAYTQRRGMTNKEKALYYIELAGATPDSFDLYMKRANYFLKLAKKHCNNSNMYFDKSKEEFKRLKKNEEN